MLTITIVDRSGAETVVDGKVDLSIMEIIRDAGLDDLLALCGGCCSCATCHVYVDPSIDAKLPPMSEDEDDLLASSAHRDVRSRLSCQIPFGASLNGLRVTIAPEE